MSDELVPSVVTEAWRNTEPGAPPIEALLEGGAQQHHRRRVVVGALSAGTALAVALAVGVLILLDRGEPGPDSGQVATDSTQRTSEEQQVGMAQVAILVPRDWVTHQLPSCNAPTTSFIYFVPQPAMSCPPPVPPTSDSAPTPSSVGIGFVDEGLTFAGSFTRDGIVVKTTEVSCSGGLCEQTFAAAGVAFTIRAPESDARELLGEIGSSVRRIPDTHVAVPYIEPGTLLEEGVAVLSESGLVGEPEATYTRNASLVLRVEPAPGVVVRRGSTVLLDVSPD